VDRGEQRHRLGHRDSVRPAVAVGRLRQVGEGRATDTGGELCRPPGLMIEVDGPSAAPPPHPAFAGCRVSDRPVAGGLTLVRARSFYRTRPLGLRHRRCPTVVGGSGGLAAGHRVAGRS